MKARSLSLTPEDVRILAHCPLHYHFARQQATMVRPLSDQARLDQLVRSAIRQLHAAGGPARLSLADCLELLGGWGLARRMVSHYYHRLAQDWSNLIASNEHMTLRISIGGVNLVLEGTIDRLDKTSDGGILAILFQTGREPLPAPEDMRQDPALTAYHALVAATYPLKRPVRIQALWLQADQAVTIEMGEAEYRHNLSRLREPLRALARGEVMARPGLHCDVCPFKYHGCPVYSHEADSEIEPDNFVSDPPDGKIPPRTWIFKK